LPSTAEERVRSQIAQAESLLDTGSYSEAADIFGRVLLLDPSRDDARRGLDRARSALAEQRRRMDGRLAEARRAIELGDAETARGLLAQVVKLGGDRDQAHALLDRLDERTGRIGAAPLPREAGSSREQGPRRHRSAFPRQLFVAAWTFMFVTAAVGLAFSWERLVGSLVRSPAPTSVSLPPSTRVPRPAAGDEALAEARRLLERGDPVAALHVLDGVAPTEPAYPFARELRRQALMAIGRSVSR
jgi:tetratricopeptide (TPR) repeat protein